MPLIRTPSEYFPDSYESRHQYLKQYHLSGYTGWRQSTDVILEGPGCSSRRPLVQTLVRGTRKRPGHLTLFRCAPMSTHRSTSN